MKKKSRSQVINLIDDMDLSTIELDDDDDNNDMTTSLVMIDDASTVSINDDTLNTTVGSPQKQSSKNDSHDVITIDDEDSIVFDFETTQVSNNGEGIVEICNKKLSEKSKNDVKPVEDKDTTGIINKNQPNTSNIGEKSVENENLVDSTTKEPSEESNNSENPVRNEDSIEVVDKNQPETSNIVEKSVEDEEIIEVFNTNQTGSASVTSADCENKVTGVDENSEKVEVTPSGKRKRKRKGGAKCSSSAKRAKPDTTGKSVAVLSNLGANLVADASPTVSETCANMRAAALSGRIGNKNKKRWRAQLKRQRKLCRALKRSLQSDPTKIGQCLQLLDLPPRLLEGNKKKNVEDGGKENDGSDKNKTNDNETINEKKKNVSEEECEDDDVILVSDAETVTSLRPSQTKPADLSKYKGSNLTLFGPSSNTSMLSQWFRPKSKSGSSSVKSSNLSANWGTLKLQTGSSSGSNSSNLSALCFQSQTASNCGPNSSNVSANWCGLKSLTGSSSGPLQLNVVADNKSPSPDSVTAIDDGAKVAKPRPEPVASTSTSQLSLVGYNMFVPSCMPARKGPRPVFIDGCNVAFSHGNNVTFSVRGIEICVDYFRRLGNRAFVVLPNHRKGYLSDTLLRRWESDGTLVITPSRRMKGATIVSDDDRYVIQCAAAMEGIIVTKDQYRDHMGINPIWDETIKKRLLILTWLQDILIFPEDPLGKHGPKLKNFLMY